MKTLLRLVVLCLAVPAGVVLAQEKATQEKPMVSQDPLSTWNKFAYARVKDMLLKSRCRCAIFGTAEAVP